MAETGGKVEPKRTLDGRAVSEGSPQEQLSALNHPARREILRRLREVGEARSASELAMELRLPLNQVSYHLKILEKYNAVAHTDSSSVKGAVEHFFASTVRSELLVNLWLDTTANGDAR